MNKFRLLLLAITTVAVCSAAFAQEPNLVVRTGEAKKTLDKVLDAAQAIQTRAFEDFWRDIVNLDTVRSQQIEDLQGQVKWWQACDASAPCLHWLAGEPTVSQSEVYGPPMPPKD